MMYTVYCSLKLNRMTWFFFTN